jgi:hypothetical protein
MNSPKSYLSTAAQRHLRFVAGILEAIDVLADGDKPISLLSLRVLADTAGFHAEQLLQEVGMDREEGIIR